MSLDFLAEARLSWMAVLMPSATNNLRDSDVTISIHRFPPHIDILLVPSSSSFSMDSFKTLISIARLLTKHEISTPNTSSGFTLTSGFRPDKYPARRQLWSRD